MCTRFFDYHLALNAPLLISTAEGDPNSVETALFVPGSAIRGAVAAALSRAGSRHFEDIVLSGAVRFLNAYPALLQADGKATRALPVPRSWRAEKYDATRIHDFSGGRPADQAIQYTSPGISFVTPAARHQATEPRVHRNFHQQRDRIKGRPTEADGAIFTYEALDAASAFAGVIAVSGEDERQIDDRVSVFKTLLTSGRLRLGRSRNTQYGGEAEITWVGNGRDREVQNWRAILSQPVDAGAIFRLFLTSPAIVRDQDGTGQVDPGALESTILNALPVTVEARFVATTVAGGFNATWRLALPQSPAVGAGSILVVKAAKPISLETLTAFEAIGIGERRAEGFGCIVALDEPSPTVIFEHPTDANLEVPPPQERPPALEAIQSRLFDQAVTRAVELRAASVVDSASGPYPSRALIGRLRTPLRRGTGGVTELADLLGSGQHALKSAARRQLERLRIQNQYFDEWLRKAMGTSDVDLDALGDALFTGVPLERNSIAGMVDQQTKRNRVRMAQPLFVDAVLALLAKRSAGA